MHIVVKIKLYNKELFFGLGCNNLYFVQYCTVLCKGLELSLQSAIKQWLFRFSEGLAKFFFEFLLFIHSAFVPDQFQRNVLFLRLLNYDL